MQDQNATYYRDGRLHMESVALSDLAGQVGTPFYCYSRQALERQIETCIAAFARIGASIHYAVKANSNLAVLGLMARAGLGADIVSDGELQRALAAGIDPAKIIFSGVGKTTSELMAALDAGVGQFNLESLPELQRLERLCHQHGRRAEVSIRVNPEVDAATHRHITTGLRGGKFGIPFEQLEPALQQIEASSALGLRGLAVHIGSQILQVQPYREACRRLREWVLDLRSRGFGIHHLDLGGGFGVDYGDGRQLHYAAVAAVIGEALGDLNVGIAVEPGRSLVAGAGILVSRVIYRKTVAPTPFLILDTGMNDLLRPALYQAIHPLLPILEPTGAEEVCNVVGPICESSDWFLKEARLPIIQQGDCVALLQAGAYGAVMASGYNSRDIIPEVLVEGDRFRLVRARIPQSDLLAYEQPL